MKSKLILLTLAVGMIGCKEDIKSSHNDYPINKTQNGEDSLIQQLYPINVIQVNKSTLKGYKWEVTIENGAMYYTNTKPKIGDPAFYIGNDSETLYWIK